MPHTPQRRAALEWSKFRAEFAERLSHCHPPLTAHATERLKNKIKDYLLVFAEGFISREANGRFIDVARHHTLNLPYRDGSRFYSVDALPFTFGPPLHHKRIKPVYRGERKTPAGRLRRDLVNLAPAEPYWNEFFAEFSQRCDHVRPKLQQWERLELAELCKRAILVRINAASDHDAIIEGAREPFNGKTYRRGSPYCPKRALDKLERSLPKSLKPLNARKLRPDEIADLGLPAFVPTESD